MGCVPLSRARDGRLPLDLVTVTAHWGRANLLVATATAGVQTLAEPSQLVEKFVDPALIGVPGFRALYASQGLSGWFYAGHSRNRLQ